MTTEPQMTPMQRKQLMLRNMQKQKRKAGYYIGVDPGVKGGISLVKYDKLNNTCEVIKSYSIPVYSVHDAHLTEQKKKRNLRMNNNEEVKDVIVQRILFKDVQDILNEFKTFTDIVIYEDVYGYQDQRADYSFTFGFASGGIYSLLVCSGFRICRIDPYVWKNKMNIPGKKENGVEKNNFEQEVWEHANRHLSNLNEEDFIGFHDYHQENRHLDGKLDSCMLGKIGGMFFNTLKFDVY